MDDRKTYVTAAGPAALSIGIAWAAALETPVLFAIPQKSQLDGNVVTDAIGLSAARALSKGVPVSFKIGLPPITLFTERDRRMTWSGAVLAVFPTRRLLDKIDQLGASEVFVVPWTDQEVAFWIEAWSPRSVGHVRMESTESLSPAVVRALGDLTRSINLSTGLGHDLDRQSAVDLLERLRDEGVAFSPPLVRAWLVRNGWEPRHADSMERLCADVIAGKRLKGRRKRWSDEAVRRWLGTDS